MAFSFGLVLLAVEVTHLRGSTKTRAIFQAPDLFIRNILLGLSRDRAASVSELHYVLFYSVLV